MTSSTQFTADQARAIGEQIGIDWATAPFDVEQFRSGMDVELEHGHRDPRPTSPAATRSSPGRSRSRT